ncbi:MAG: GNAT family N-acetyltransferase [Thermoplasmata archaeon]|nr:GNAT family N-acetyltransferase [Thermoplasmata archaeon]
MFVVHEKIPFPRFNFIQEVDVRRERATGFFEFALDHYFARAIRPTFRVAASAPAHVEGALARLGFQRRACGLTLLHAVAPGTTTAALPSIVVRPARASELDSVVNFFASPPEQLELRRQIEVAWDRPGADESLTPLLALRDGEPVATALLHRHRNTTGLHGVATQPSARGRGVATALVARALRDDLTPSGQSLWLAAEHPALERHLAPLGFHSVASYSVFDLPLNAELSLPPPGPPGPARWRPPRRSSTGGA